MYLRSVLIFLGVSLYSFTFVYAQDYGQIDAGISYQIGGESTANYDAFYKIAYQKELIDKTSFHFYTRTSFQTNIGPNYARALVYDLTFGTNYFLNKKLFLLADLGGMYWNEKLAVDLPEIPSELSISHPGIKVRTGLGYQIADRFPVQLTTEFFGNEATLLFMTIGYKFKSE